MKNNKQLAVIILNYNDSQHAIPYVRKIKNYNCINKIIVVDNCSTDDSYKKLLKLKDNKVDVIQTQKNNGYAKGNNYAINYLNEKYGEYEIIAISNPDVEVSEESYNACLKYLKENKKVAVCAPRQYYPDGTAHVLSGWKIRNIKEDLIESSDMLTYFSSNYLFEKYDDEHFRNEEAYVDCFVGSFFLIKNKIFKELGYFDENTFLYYEEDILGYKLKQLGYKNVILTDYKFIHHESVSVNKSMNYLRKYKNMQKSRIYYHKNYTKCNILWIFLLRFFTWFRPIELYFTQLKNKWISSRIYKKYFPEGILIKIFKTIMLFINILLLPYFYIEKLFRKKEKVLYFSIVTWKWIKQRPHFVPLELVKNGYKVDYRYQTLYDKYTKYDQQELVKNKISKIKNFNIIPFKIYPEIGFHRTLNKYISIFRTSLWNYDKVIITNPNQIEKFFFKPMRLKGTKIYYECMDNYEGWETNKKFYRELESRLISISNKIIVSSEKLKDRMKKLYNIDPKKCVVIRNGYDKELFENYEEHKVDLHHPCITYIGTVAEWVDFEALEYYAEKNRDVYIEMIGPIANPIKNKTIEIAKKHPNIIFHKPIEHSEVPSYIKNSDVLLIPFLINDIIEYVDPVKMYEYLYLEKPVVSCYWKELKQFTDLAYFYNGKKDFCKKVNLAFKNKLELNNKHKKIIKESSWENRLKKYIDAIK